MGEGLRVGYKWFDAEKKEPLFPFGYGLSYTGYAYSSLTAKSGKTLDIGFIVRNIGYRLGEEITQVYLEFPAAAGEPPKRLVGWQKLTLASGESKTVSLSIDPLYLSVFDSNRNEWKVVPGEYRVLAGSSSRDLPLTAQVKLGAGGGSN